LGTVDPHIRLRHNYSLVLHDPTVLLAPSRRIRRLLTLPLSVLDLYLALLISYLPLLLSLADLFVTPLLILLLP
jgi:hypothetical protein